MAPKFIPAELKKRIFFTLMCLLIFRFGVALPTPGVNGQELIDYFNQQGGSLFGVFNTFTGGAFERFSVLSLGIMPYISASIIFQILQTAIPTLEALKKEGEQGRKKLNQYIRYSTVLIAFVQSYGLTKFLQNTPGPAGPIVQVESFGPIPFELMTMLTLTAGTCFLLWLGELMTERGVGNGVSLIIFAGIAAGIPSGTVTLWDQISRGELSGILGLGLVLFMFAVVMAIVFMETGQRRIPVQYSQRAGAKPGQAKQVSHLPLKINFAGVIPPIFASSLLLFPATLTQFTDNESVKNFAENFLQPTGALFSVLFVACIAFFCFFYTEIVFNAKEVSDNLKKHGGFIPGIRAGQSTSLYLRKVLDRLTVVGAIYLSLICILPTILISQFNLPFYFGGTGLLILVGVILDTTQQIQSHLITAQYDTSFGGVKMKTRRVKY